MYFIDYGIIDYFDDNRRVWFVKTSYNRIVYIRENNITGSPKTGIHILIGEIKNHFLRNEYEGNKITIWNRDIQSFHQEIFNFWLSKKPLKFNKDIKWLLNQYSEEILKQIINSNINDWQNVDEFLTYLEESEIFHKKNIYKNQSYIDIARSYFYEVWVKNGSKNYDQNLACAIGDGNIFLEKALQIDSNWINDIHFIKKFSESKFSKNIVFSFLESRISNKKIKDYDDDIKWILNNGDISIFSFIFELKFLYSNEEFINDIGRLKYRYSKISNNDICHLLYDLWIFKGELKCNEDIKWILHDGNADLINKIIDINYSNWLLDNEFIATMKESSLRSKKDDIISIIDNFIYNVWKSLVTKELDENLKWIIQNRKLNILLKIVNLDKEKWLKNEDFIDYIQGINYHYNRVIKEKYLFEVCISISEMTYETTEFDEHLKWIIQNINSNTLRKLTDCNKHLLLYEQDFKDLIFDIYCDKQNFEERFKEYYLQNFIQNILFEVCMTNSEIASNKTLIFFLLFGKIDNIKKLLKTKFGYKPEIIEKIHLAFFPANNSDFYRQKAINSTWSEDVKWSYVEKQESYINYEFSQLFINEIKENQQKLTRKKSIKKETHAATDLANFVFCPASYAINQTFKLDFQENESIFIGTQEHEKQRLLSISERNEFENSKSYFKKHAEYPFFDKILNSKCISQGHKDNNSVIYFSKKKKLSGIPDYIFLDSTGYFAVEEKYTLKKYDELTDLYLNHKIQALVYLYGLDDFKFNEVFVLYWFINKNDSGGYQVYNFKLFRLTRTKENEKMILDVFNDLEFIQQRVPYSFPPNNINYKKCIKCNYFPYCEYKKGNTNIIQLSLAQSE